MIATTKANEILDDLFRTQGTSKRYLGFSSTTPTLGADGTIGNFTEPAASTGYRRVLMDAAAQSGMDAAANAAIKNGTYNITFAVPNKDQQYGSATHIGVFETETGGKPTLTAALSEAQTLGLKTTLVLYKNDLTATLTATETTGNT